MCRGQLEPPKPVTGYTLGVEIDDKTRQGLSPQRQKVLAILRDGMPRRAAELAEEAGCSSGVVKGMLKRNLVRTVDLYAPSPCRKPDPHRPGPVLSEAQQQVADRLCQAVKEGGYYTGLLDGVTGAGKTEVYFEAVAAALEKGQQVLILLPEIALSNAFLDRFPRQRFGCAPALWHSSLSAGAAQDDLARGGRGAFKSCGWGAVGPVSAIPGSGTDYCR